MAACSRAGRVCLACWLLVRAGMSISVEPQGTSHHHDGVVAGWQRTSSTVVQGRKYSYESNASSRLSALAVRSGLCWPVPFNSVRRRGQHCISPARQVEGATGCAQHQPALSILSIHPSCNFRSRRVRTPVFVASGQLHRSSLGRSAVTPQACPAPSTRPAILSVLSPTLNKRAHYHQLLGDLATIAPVLSTGKRPSTASTCRLAPDPDRRSLPHPTRATLLTP